MMMQLLLFHVKFFLSLGIIITNQYDLWSIFVYRWLGKLLEFEDGIQCGKLNQDLI